MKKALVAGIILGGAAAYFSTTPKGKELTNLAKKELNELKENYPELVEQIKTKALALIEQKNEPTSPFDVLLTDKTVSKEEDIEK